MYVAHEDLNVQEVCIGYDNVLFKLPLTSSQKLLPKTASLLYCHKSLSYFSRQPAGPCISLTKHLQGNASASLYIA